MVPRLQELIDFSLVLVVGRRKVDLSGCRLDGKQIIELEGPASLLARRGSKACAGKHLAGWQEGRARGEDVEIRFSGQRPDSLQPGAKPQDPDGAPFAALKARLKAHPGNRLSLNRAFSAKLAFSTPLPGASPQATLNRAFGPEAGGALAPLTADAVT